MKKVPTGSNEQESEAPSATEDKSTSGVQKPKIKFTNDGSFLEKFKEKQRLKREQEAQEAEEKRRHEKVYVSVLVCKLLVFTLYSSNRSYIVLVVSTGVLFFGRTGIQFLIVNYNIGTWSYSL